MSAQTDTQPDGPAPIATAILAIPSLADETAALDLGAPLLSVSGVAHVHADIASHRLMVEYDPDVLGEKSLGEMITSAGYPVGSGEGNA